jgi:uncharacterized protein
MTLTPAPASGPSIVSKALRAMVLAYQAASAGRSPACRFVPSCSDYALEAIERFGARKGIPLVLRRLARCRPGGPFGLDPVPGRPNLVPEDLGASAGGRTSEDGTRQGPSQEGAGPEGVCPDCAGPDCAGPDCSGPDGAGPEDLSPGTFLRPGSGSGGTPRGLVMSVARSEAEKRTA